MVRWELPFTCSHCVGLGLFLLTILGEKHLFLNGLRQLLGDEADGNPGLWDSRVLVFSEGHGLCGGDGGGGVCALFPKLDEG